jgi:hypothetical protein
MGGIIWRCPLQKALSAPGGVYRTELFSGGSPFEQSGITASSIFSFLRYEKRLSTLWKRVPFEDHSSIKFPCRESRFAILTESMAKPPAITSRWTITS